MQSCPSCSSSWIVMSVQQKSATCMSCKAKWTIEKVDKVSAPLAAAQDSLATVAAKSIGALG